MGRVLESITEKETTFIRSQKVFFVATAALSADHHVNVSPMAPGTGVIVLDPHTVAYADLTGSGAETAAHVMENERMTLMFCNIEKGPPQILRLHGKARVVVKEEISPSMLETFPKEITTNKGFRCIYILKVHRISSSCGYSLPVMHFERCRKILDEFTEKKGEKGMDEYGIYKNSFSIDGLPSLGLIRNKDKTIVPNPKDGYIFGKEVEAGCTRSAYKIPIKDLSGLKLISQECLFMLALGTLLGTVVTGVYFQYSHEQS
jgi:hypothetical protein